MAKTPRKLQILTELLSEEKVLQLIAEQLGRLVVIGPDEPDYGPVLWFDTNGTISKPDNVVELVLVSGTDKSDVLAELDGIEYSVLNAQSPIIGDDGQTVFINVTK